MTLFLQILCLTSLYGILHTYLVYPLLLFILSRGKDSKPPETSQHSYQVSILMAAYNEEAVIGEKLDNLRKLERFGNTLHVFVGSDASSDNTEVIVRAAQDQMPNLHFFPFSDRRGKPSVLNDLASEAEQLFGSDPRHIFLITDANVFLSTDLLQELLPWFADPTVALVDTRMVNTDTGPGDISESEATYISLEGNLKQWESKLWKTMMGPFGGCYALRSDRFQPVPPHFLVDDFYIALSVFSAGFFCVNAPGAVVYESASRDIREEFRRKARISAGNFQNLARFRHLLRPFTRVGFALISHKVLRWLTPVLLILTWISSGLLAIYGNFWYGALFFMLSAGVLVFPLIDRIFITFGIHLLPLRHLRYFVRMNMALLVGLNRYRKGIRAGTWEPTKRVKTNETNH